MVFNGGWQGQSLPCPECWRPPHGRLWLSVAMSVAGALGFGAGAHGMEAGRGGTD